MVVRRRRRWWWIAAGIVVVVAVSAFVLVRFVFLHDTTTALSSDDVLARYRASTTVASPGSPASVAVALPATGVYRYATTGSEHVDALGGTTHTYPATTTVTVTAAGCGVQTRWDALQERWNTRQVCLGDGGIVTGAYTDFHRFYGQDDRSDWMCAPAYVLVPAAPIVGRSWTGACTDDAGSSEVTTLTVVGVEAVAVAGQSVPVVHVQRVDDDGAKNSTAHTTTDQWFDDRTGLVLREVASSSATTSTFMGDVHYTEQYELKIMALDPQR